MINWLYQTGLDVSLLIGLVLLLRHPIRKILGANIAYWLWAIPAIRMLVWNKTEIHSAAFEKINFTDGSILIKVFNNPKHLALSNNLNFEVIWLLGMAIWVVLRLFGYVKFRKNLDMNSSRFNFKELKLEELNDKNISKVEFFYTKLDSAPFVTGLIRAQVYLNEADFNNLNQVQQQCIIKHELTHLQRKDLWIQVLAELFRTVFWFNPIMHIVWHAFRQDQELACDYQVLASSNNLERFEYGRVLLKGLHAHALPATMAFFNNHKQRFIMLEKHNNSKLNNLLGIILCGILIVFALTKAPQSVATESSNDNKVSFEFDEIPLKSVLMLIFDANPRDIIGYDNIPDLNISLKASKVSSSEVERLILKCSGLKLIPQQKIYKIVKDPTFNNDFSELDECVHIKSDIDSLSQETITTKTLITILNAFKKEQEKE